MTPNDQEDDDEEGRICVGEWVSGSGGHRVFGGCGKPADWIEAGTGCSFCRDHARAMLEAVFQNPTDEVPFDAKAAWASFTPEQVVAMVEAAPTVCPPWEDRGGISSRRGFGGTLRETDYEHMRRVWYVPVLSGSREYGPYNTLQEAKDALDAHLRAKGHILL